MKFTKSETVATTRTGWYIGFVMAVAFLLNRFTGLNLNWSDLEDNAIIVGAATVLYRIALVLQEKVPILGYILFGINSAPSYDAPVRPLDADVVLPPDKGWVRSNTLWTILVVLGIIVLIVLLIRWVDVKVE